MQPFPCTQADRTKIYPSGHPFRTKYGTGNGRIRPGPRPPPGTGRANGSFHYPALPSHKVSLRSPSGAPLAREQNRKSRPDRHIPDIDNRSPIHRTRRPNRQAAETSIFHNSPKTQGFPSTRNEKRAAAGRPYPAGRRLLTERSEEPRQKQRPAENRLPVRFPGSFRTLSAKFDFFVFPHGFYGHGNAHEKIRFDDQSPFEIREKS